MAGWGGGTPDPSSWRRGQGSPFFGPPDPTPPPGTRKEPRWVDFHHSPSRWPVAPPSCPLLALLLTAVTGMFQDSTQTPSGPAQQPTVAPHVPEGGAGSVWWPPASPLTSVHPGSLLCLSGTISQEGLTRTLLSNPPNPVQRPPPPGSLPLLPGLESCVCICVVSTAPSTHEARHPLNRIHGRYYY